MSFPFKYVNMDRLSWWSVVNMKMRVPQICLPLVISEYFLPGLLNNNILKKKQSLPHRVAVYTMPAFLLYSVPTFPPHFWGLPSSQINHLKSITAKNLDALLPGSATLTYWEGHGPLLSFPWCISLSQENPSGERTLPPLHNIYSKHNRAQADLRVLWVNILKCS